MNFVFVGVIIEFRQTRWSHQTKAVIFNFFWVLRTHMHTHNSTFIWIDFSTTASKEGSAHQFFFKEIPLPCRMFW